MRLGLRKLLTRGSFHVVRILIAPILLAAAPLASCNEQLAAASSPKASGCQKVEIAGRSYFFPADDEEFLATNFEDVEELGSAAEVGLPHHFWMKVYGSVREVSGWLSWDSGVLTPAYLTQPNEIFEWHENRRLNEPSVRGPVELEEVRAGYRIWRSRDPEIKIRRRYATFDADPNVYVSINFDALDDPDEGLDLIWNDSGILHRMNLPGDWVRDAPAVARAYAQIVKADCRIASARVS